MVTKPNKDQGNKVPSQQVRPLEGWTVQTAYGTLKTHAGVELVRLEEVHTWMCGEGKPAGYAVYEIFSPFYMACLSAVEDRETSALDLPGKLHVLNALAYPSGLMFGAAQNKQEAVNVFATGFPELGHVRFSEGSMGSLIYSIAEGAKRVWHGAADLSTDHLAAWKDRRERESASTYEIKWPKDDDLRKLLGRVAVPIETAYELWGWGSVVEVIPLRDVSKGGSAEPTNWKDLVAFRKQHPTSEWTTKQKEIVATEATRRKAAPGAKGVAVSMAGELGITVSRFNELIRTKKDSNKRTIERVNAR